MAISPYSDQAISEKEKAIKEGEKALKAATDELAQLPKNMPEYPAVKKEVGSLRGYILQEKNMLHALQINAAVNRPHQA